MSELFTFEGFKKSDLCHHGIKGMQWGVRRFQNPDGSLTPLGKQRYREIIKKDYDYTPRKNGHMTTDEINHLHDMIERFRSQNVALERNTSLFKNQIKTAKYNEELEFLNNIYDTERKKRNDDRDKNHNKNLASFRTEFKENKPEKITREYLTSAIKKYGFDVVDKILTVDDKRKYLNDSNYSTDDYFDKNNYDDDDIEMTFFYDFKNLTR